MVYRLALSCHTAEDAKPCSAGHTPGNDFDTNTEPCSSKTPKFSVNTTTEYTRIEADQPVEGISEHSVDASSDDDSFEMLSRPDVHIDHNSSNTTTMTSLEDYSVVNAEDTGGDAIVSRTSNTTGGATVPSHDTSTDDDIGGQLCDAADTVAALPSDPEVAEQKHAHLG